MSNPTEERSKSLRRWASLAVFLAVLLGAEACVLLQGRDSWYAGATEAAPLAAIVGLAVATVYLWLSSRWRLRWYQVDLRTFAVATSLVAVLAAICGPYLTRGYRERAALAAIRAKTKVHYESDIPGWTAAILRPLFGDDVTRYVHQIHVTSPTDADLQYIGRLHDLRNLMFRNCQATDAGFERLATLRRLEILHVESSVQTPVKVNLRPFLGNDQLRQLSLRNARVDVHDVAKLRSLESLSLSACGLEESDIAVLAPLSQLTSLDLSADQITGSGLEALTHLRLERLSFTRSTIRDGALASIAKFGNLGYLDLCSTSITDRGLESIAKMRSLKELKMQQTWLSAERVKRLREQLPQCTIQWWR